jgi:hypothetical protein
MALGIGLYLSPKEIQKLLSLKSMKAMISLFGFPALQTRMGSNQDWAR